MDLWYMCVGNENYGIISLQQFQKLEVLLITNKKACS